MAKKYYYNTMRFNFYICRHGQTDKNVQGVWQGCGTDVTLNENGVKQAEELGMKFRMKVVEIYSSPLLRAVQTANAIARTNIGQGDIVIMQNLRECDFGEAEGVSFDAVKQQYGEAFVNRILFPTEETADLCFPKGESKRQVFKRVIDCFMKIVDKQKSDEAEYNQQIVIVCHAGVISALQYGLGLKNVSYENCAVLHLQYDTCERRFVQCFD